MGAWGPGLYQDDVAEDVKESYKEYLQQGMDNEQAYQKMLESYRDEIADEEDGSVFWFALADTMWRVGRLTDEVRDKALACIEEGKDLARWEEEGKAEARRRREVLTKLGEKLKESQPKEKSFRKKQKRILKNKWQLGDMYTLPVEEKYPRFPQVTAKYILLIKVDDAEEAMDENIQPVVHIKLLEEEFSENIDIDSLQTVLPNPEYYQFLVLGIAGRKLPDKLTYVGNCGEEMALKLREQHNECTDGKIRYSAHYAHGFEYRVIHLFLRRVENIPVEQICLDTLYLTQEEYQAKLDAEEEFERSKKHDIMPDGTKWQVGQVYFYPLSGTKAEGVAMMKIREYFDYYKRHNPAVLGIYPEVIMELLNCKPKSFNAEELRHLFSQEIYTPQIMLTKGLDDIPKEVVYLGSIEISLEGFNPRISGDIRNSFFITWDRLEAYCKEKLEGNTSQE